MKIYIPLSSIWFYLVNYIAKPKESIQELIAKNVEEKLKNE